MANMAYCRFRNTLADLSDCYDAFTELGFDGLNNEEQMAARRLIKLCAKFANDYLDEVDE